MSAWHGGNPVHLGQGSSLGSATSGTDGGSDSVPEQDSFTGLLDEMAIFGDELSEEQRRLLFHNGEGLYYDPVTAMWRTVQPEDLVVQEGVARRATLVPMGQNRMMLSADPAILLCQYVWGGRPGHRDELICRDGNPESESWLPRYYCLMDYYDPTSIVNTSGVVQERYRFSAFGNRTVMTADFSERASSEYAWNFAYKGQFRDDETGYYNYGFRYYSPEIGRWLSRDPIGENDDSNLYKMANNNSVNGLDLYGLDAGCCSAWQRIPTMERWNYDCCGGNLEHKFDGHSFHHLGGEGQDQAIANYGSGKCCGNYDAGEWITRAERSAFCCDGNKKVAKTPLYAYLEMTKADCVNQCGIVDITSIPDIIANGAIVGAITYYGAVIGTAITLGLIANNITCIALCEQLVCPHP